MVQRLVTNITYHSVLLVLILYRVWEGLGHYGARAVCLTWLVRPSHVACGRGDTVKDSVRRTTDCWEIIHTFNWCTLDRNKNRCVLLVVFFFLLSEFSSHSIHIDFVVVVVHVSWCISALCATPLYHSVMAVCRLVRFPRNCHVTFLVSYVP